MSPKTQHKAGWRAKSPRPSPPRLAFCWATATLHMVRPSAIASRRWRSKRSSPRHDRHGRTPMSNASSALSAANASITSSPSMNVTCAECCGHTLSITTEVARISRSARIVRSLGPYSHPLLALFPSHSSVACTIATSVAQPKLFAVTERVPPSRCRASSPCAIPSLECRRGQSPCREPESQERSTLFDNRTSSVAVFIGKPIPWPDGFLSRDNHLQWRMLSLQSASNRGTCWASQRSRPVGVRVPWRSGIDGGQHAPDGIDPLSIALCGRTSL